jgi:hypothetical protein
MLASAFAAVSILLNKDYFRAHSWWQSLIESLPALALPIIAFFELRHSAEADVLRSEANRNRDEANEQRAEANRFRDEANEQRAEANRERARASDALNRIADQSQRARTKAERNAERLRPFMRKSVQVINNDDSRWVNAAEIVEIKDEVVTLFTPCSSTSTTAFAVHVHCDQLEIVEGSAGPLQLTLKILRRYGVDQNLGEIKTWENRGGKSAVPQFSKGPNVSSAQYTKSGSPERRRLDVFESASGENEYMLVNSQGETMFGDNKEVSRKFLLMQLEYESQGFRYDGGSSGGSKHELYIKKEN